MILYDITIDLGNSSDHATAYEILHEWIMRKYGAASSHGKQVILHRAYDAQTAVKILALCETLAITELSGFVFSMVRTVRP